MSQARRYPAHNQHTSTEGSPVTPGSSERLTDSHLAGTQDSDRPREPYRAAVGMKPTELFTLRQVADALGQPHRRVRSWADAGILDAISPARHAMRLVAASELQRLASERGFTVDWTRLEPDSAT